MEPLTVLILAGGQSTRMGQDKAWLELDGMPLVERVARRLLPVAAEILVSTNQPDRYVSVLARLGVPARPIVDEFPGAGPLAGLHAGLSVATNDMVFAVATDMPFVDTRLVEAMIAAREGADAVLPRIRVAGQADAQPEPLHALYRRTCLPAIESALRAGRRRAIAFLPEVTVRYVDEDFLRRIDPELMSFRNANTPEDWAAVQRQLDTRE